MGPNIIENLQFEPVSLMKIQGCIINLSLKTASGDDEICNTLLKEVGYTILPLLQHLYNNCIGLSKIPDIWKSGKVSAINIMQKRGCW